MRENIWKVCNRKNHYDIIPDGWLAEMMAILILNGGDLNLASEAITFFKGWKGINAIQHHSKWVLKALWAQLMGHIN